LGCNDNGDLFPCHIPTFAHYLTNQGYDTVLSGKMYFVGSDQLHGFQRRLTTDVHPSSFDWSQYLLDEEGTKLHLNGCLIESLSVRSLQQSGQGAHLLHLDAEELIAIEKISGPLLKRINTLNVSKYAACRVNSQGQLLGCSSSRFVPRLGWYRRLNECHP